MIEIAVLKTAEDKNMREESIDIPELGCRVCVIFVPFKRKVKRRIRAKLTKILINYAYVLAENEKLTAYEKGRSFKSLFYYYPRDTILHITQNAPCASAAVVAASVTPLLKKTVLELGTFYRIVTIYTIKESEMKEFSEGLYESVGLPIHVKTLDLSVKPAERYLIRIADDITVFDSAENIEYADLAVVFRFPLSKYKTLPLTDIFKICLDAGLSFDLFPGGKVKIVGEISK